MVVISGGDTNTVLSKSDIQKINQIYNQAAHCQEMKASYARMIDDQAEQIENQRRAIIGYRSSISMLDSSDSKRDEILNLQAEKISKLEKKNAFSETLNKILIGMLIILGGHALLSN